MEKGFKHISLSMALLGSFLVGGQALADRGEIRALSEAKLSLIEAIEIAQKDQDGIAFEAGIDDDSFRSEFDVSIVREGRIYDVEIDAKTGEVLSVREDLED